MVARACVEKTCAVLHDLFLRGKCKFGNGVGMSS